MMAYHTELGATAPKYLSPIDSVLIFRSHISGDDDISSQTIWISLKDPVTLAPLKDPCRGSKCTHLQCFDFSAYLKMNSLLKHGPSGGHVSRHFSEYMCPLCQKSACPADVYIDSITLSLISQYQEGEVVEIHRDGTVNLKSIAVELCHVVDLDSDDINLSSPPTSKSSPQNSCTLQTLAMGSSCPPGALEIRWGSLRRPHLQNLLAFINNTSATTLTCIKLINKVIDKRPIYSDTWEGLEHEIRGLKGIGLFKASKLILDILELFDRMNTEDTQYIQGIDNNFELADLLDSEGNFRPLSNREFSFCIQKVNHFIEKHGCFPSHIMDAVQSEESLLACFVAQQRKNYNSRLLPIERIDLLEAISGHRWDHSLDDTSLKYKAAPISNNVTEAAIAKCQWPASDQNSSFSSSAHVDLQPESQIAVQSPSNNTSIAPEVHVVSDASFEKHGDAAFEEVLDSMESRREGANAVSLTGAGTCTTVSHSNENPTLSLEESSTYIPIPERREEAACVKPMRGPRPSLHHQGGVVSTQLPSLNNSRKRQREITHIADDPANDLVEKLVMAVASRDDTVFVSVAGTSVAFPRQPRDDGISLTATSYNSVSRVPQHVNIPCEILAENSLAQITNKDREERREALLVEANAVCNRRASEFDEEPAVAMDTIQTEISEAQQRKQLAVEETQLTHATLSSSSLRRVTRSSSSSSAASSRRVTRSSSSSSASPSYNITPASSLQHSRVTTTEPTEAEFMPVILRVSGIPHEMTESAFAKFFRTCGEPICTTILSRKKLKRFKGRGFVIFSTRQHANAALKLHGTFWRGFQSCICLNEVSIVEAIGIKPRPVDIVIICFLPPCTSKDALCTFLSKWGCGDITWMHIANIGKSSFACVTFADATVDNARSLQLTGTMWNWNRLFVTLVPHAASEVARWDQETNKPQKVPRRIPSERSSLSQDQPPSNVSNGGQNAEMLPEQVALGSETTREKPTSFASMVFNNMWTTE